MKAYFVLFVFVCISCSGSQKIVSPTPKSRALDALVEKGKFEVTSDQASPLLTSSMAAISNSGLLGNGNSAGNINLIGNPNYLKVEGDTISADLPYYGERQMGGGYNSNAGIKFKGVPQNYSLTKNETNQQYQINFQISGEGAENFTISLILFPNWKSSLQINSSQRTPIRYTGEVQALKER